MGKELVYKFRDCENEFHRRIILKNEIYFASPKSFNDPFDCHVDYDFLSLTDAERVDYINDNIQYEKEEAILRGESIDKKRLRIIIQETLDDKAKLLEFQKKYNEDNFKTLNNKIGVFCCNEDSNDEEGWQNILLWSHYANGHKGFCIGFNKKMLSTLFPNGKAVGTSYPRLKPLVGIEKNRKKIITNFVTEVSSKAKAWSYENEIRFVKINTDKNRTVILSQDFIVEVTMGLWIDDWHKNAIKTICKSKGIKLYQAEKKPFEFSITRIEI